MAKIDEIKRILQEQKAFLKEKYKVKSIGVFGSFSRGEQTRKSDVDILIEFSEGISLLEFIKIENYLTDLIGIKVDLVMKDALKPRIGKHILNEVISL